MVKNFLTLEPYKTQILRFVKNNNLSTGLTLGKNTLVDRVKTPVPSTSFSGAIVAGKVGAPQGSRQRQERRRTDKQAKIFRRPRACGREIYFNE